MITRFEELTNEELIFNEPFYKKIYIRWDEFSKEQTFTDEYYAGNSYEPYKFEIYKTFYGEGFKKLLAFIGGDFQLYGTCIKCQKQTPFSVNKNVIDKDLQDDIVRSYTEFDIDNEEFYCPEPKNVMKSRLRILEKNYKYFSVTCRCPMCNSIYKTFFMVTVKNASDSIEVYLEKVGQYPSIRELSVCNKNRNNKILKKIDALQDWRSSHHLHTENYNVAAFTYLRRTLEKYICYKFNKIENITKEEFISKKFDQKIEVLKEYLPKFLIENKKIYSLMSLGIHGLSEEDCKEHFKYLSQAIDIIMDEDEIEQKKEAIKIETSNQLKNAISNMTKAN